MEKGGELFFLYRDVPITAQDAIIQNPGIKTMENCMSKMNIYHQIIENPFLDGLTLSGGEPFLYCKELISLVKRVKAKGLNIWSYTGFTFEEILRWSEKNSDVQVFLQEIDVLVDGKFIIEKMEPKKHFSWKL